MELCGTCKLRSAGAGFVTSPWGKHPRRQILTIEELLAGKQLDYPPAHGVNVTFKPAPKAKKDKGSKQLSLEEAGGEECARGRLNGTLAPVQLRVLAQPSECSTDGLIDTPVRKAA